MEWNESDIDVVRKVADEMWESDDETVLPGWEPDHLGERELAIREAAMAVFGKVDPDSRSVVSERALGALLRYVVDILEP